jgi:hypothetical protein
MPLTRDQYSIIQRYLALRVDAEREGGDRRPAAVIWTELLFAEWDTVTDPTQDVMIRFLNQRDLNALIAKRDSEDGQRAALDAEITRLTNEPR